MSANKSFSIIFAKWLINQLSANSLIQDTVSIISSLDDDSFWNRFIASNDFAAFNLSTVNSLIPQLVEKMPKKPRVKKEVKPRLRMDAQTSTCDQDDTLQHENNDHSNNIPTTEIHKNDYEVPNQDSEKKPKEVKKRVPKAKKK